MILSLHRYFCFLVKGEEKESFEAATKFLNETLSYYSKLSRNKSGNINTGYDPECLDIQIPIQRWLKSTISKIKEEYGEKFDADPEKVDKDRKIGANYSPLFFGNSNQLKRMMEF